MDRDSRYAPMAMDEPTYQKLADAAFRAAWITCPRAQPVAARALDFQGRPGDGSLQQPAAALRDALRQVGLSFRSDPLHIILCPDGDSLGSERFMYKPHRISTDRY